MLEGRMWEEKSKQSLKDLLARRIKSIIGVSLQSVEDNVKDDNSYVQIRFAIMKVCNDILRKMNEDIDEKFTIKRNVYRYDLPFKPE